MDLSRAESILGADALARLSAAHVLVVGVGGVGSWCAEALVRTGLGHLTLVDDDVVAPSNANRQCPATQVTLGQPKVEAMRTRLLEINPACDVTALNARYEAEGNSKVPPLADFSFVVDAIDAVDCKAALILDATAAGAPIVSSMGAARRVDPTRVTVRRFDRIEGDGLARALRQRFKRIGRYPPGKLPCVTSTEPPCACEKGSLMQVTCAFGMALASVVISRVAHNGKGEEQ